MGYDLGLNKDDRNGEVTINGGSTVMFSASLHQNRAAVIAIQNDSTNPDSCAMGTAKLEPGDDLFLQLCRLVLGLRNSRNPFIQQTLLAVLPRLAAFNPNIFITK